MVHYWDRLEQIGYQATTEVRIKTHASILTHYCIPVPICTGTAVMHVHTGTDVYRYIIVACVDWYLRYRYKE